MSSAVEGSRKALRSAPGGRAELGRGFARIVQIRRKHVISVQLVFRNRRRHRVPFVRRSDRFGANESVRAPNHIVGGNLQRSFTEVLFRKV